MTVPTHGIPTYHILRIISESPGLTPLGLSRIFELSADETDKTLTYLRNGGLIWGKLDELHLTPIGGRTLSLMAQADQIPAVTNRMIALYHRADNAESLAESHLTDMLDYKDRLKASKKKIKYLKHRLAVFENILRSRRDE